MAAVIWTIHHGKGGVGKTTTVQHLVGSGALAEARVLALDTDSQANLTTQCKASGQPGLAEAIGAIINGDEPNPRPIPINPTTAIVPAGRELARAEASLTRWDGLRHRVIRRILAPLLDDWDVILIDTPPGDRILSQAAIVAADRLLVPVECEAMSIDGLEVLAGTLRTIAGLYEATIAPPRYVPTRVDGRRASHRANLEALRKRWGAVVTETVIRTDSTIEAAQTQDKNVWEAGLKSRAGDDYIHLGRELFGWRVNHG